MANVKQGESAIMRSMLGQVRGLGSAKSGTGHWWAQRVTSVALLPLTLWFVWSVIHLAGLPRDAVVSWGHSPLVSALLLALIAAMFHHLQLGLQAVMEDYIHGERVRMVSLLAMKGVVALLALLAVVATLKLAFA